MKSNGILFIRRKYVQDPSFSNESFQQMSKELFGILVIDPLNLSEEAKEYLKQNGTVPMYEQNSP